jgi:hypothetical protein
VIFEEAVRTGAMIFDGDSELELYAGNNIYRFLAVEVGYDI